MFPSIYRKIVTKAQHTDAKFLWKPDTIFSRLLFKWKLNLDQSLRVQNFHRTREDIQQHAQQKALTEADFSGTCIFGLTKGWFHCQIYIKLWLYTPYQSEHSKCGWTKSSPEWISRGSLPSASATEAQQTWFNRQPTACPWPELYRSICWFTFTLTAPVFTLSILDRDLDLPVLHIKPHIGMGQAISRLAQKRDAFCNDISCQWNFWPILQRDVPHLLMNTNSFQMGCAERTWSRSRDSI